jgi:hypothetical protein
VDELWSGDHAVLTKVVESYESTGEFFEPQQLLEAFPAEQHDVMRHSLRRLSTHGHIETLIVGPGLDERAAQILWIKGVTEKGLRATGAWPDDAELLADRVVAARAERAENEPNPEKQSKVKACSGRWPSTSGP